MVFCGIRYVVGFPVTYDYLKNYIEDEDELFDAIYDGNHDDIPDWLKNAIEKTNVYHLPHDITEDELVTKKYGNVAFVVGIDTGEYYKRGDVTFEIDITGIQKKMKKMNSLSAKGFPVGLYAVPNDCLCCS